MSTASPKHGTIAKIVPILTSAFDVFWTRTSYTSKITHFLSSSREKDLLRYQGSSTQSRKNRNIFQIEPKTCDEEIRPSYRKALGETLGRLDINLTILQGIEEGTAT